MKKERTIIAAVILLLVFVIGGAVAYFTDTKSVTNVFTIGDVEIELTEPSWVTTDENHNNVPDAAESRTPGQTIAKDPTIDNVGTNDAYIFAKVEAPCTTDATPKELFTYTINSGWILKTDGSCTGDSAKTVTRIYAYASGTAAEGTMTTLKKSDPAIVLFNNVTVNTAITGDEEGLTGNKNIVVTGYAIQKDGINATTPNAVWTAASFS